MGTGERYLHLLQLGENPLSTTGCQDLIEAVAEKTCTLRYLSLKV